MNYKVQSGGSSAYGNMAVEGSFLTLVVDTDNASNYILFATYRPQYPSPNRGGHYNYVIASHGLALGAQNDVGTQVVNGCTNQTWHILQF